MENKSDTSLQPASKDETWLTRGRQVCLTALAMQKGQCLVAFMLFRFPRAEGLPHVLRRLQLAARGTMREGNTSYRLVRARVNAPAPVPPPVDMTRPGARHPK